MFIIRHKSAMIIMWLSRAVLTWPPMNQKFRNIGLWIKRDFNFGLLNRRFYRFYQFYRLTETLNLAQALIGTHPEILTGNFPAERVEHYDVIILLSQITYLVRKAIIFDNVNFSTNETNWPKLTQSGQNCSACCRFKKWSILFQVQRRPFAKGSTGRVVLGWYSHWFVQRTRTGRATSYSKWSWNPVQSRRLVQI